jgi:ribosomal protein S21
MSNLVVEVHGGNIESALARLKKESLKIGLFREMKKRMEYTKPSLRRRLKSLLARKKEAKRRNQYRVRLDHNGDPI